METIPTRRPGPPSRSVPPPPIDLSQLADLALNNTTSPTLSDQAFVTPQASPFHTSYVESSPSELPPSVPSKDVESQTDEGSPSAADSTSATLTPLRAHYLKKELVQLQFHQELSALTTIPTNNISTFSYLGPPFSPPPKDGPRLDLPFLRFMFRKFVLSFPFLVAAPKDFFPDKLQPFMASMLSRNVSSAAPLDTDPENTEEQARFRVLAKLERNFAMLLTSGTKLVEEEDVVRLTQKDLDRLEMMARKRAAREKRMKDVFEVNIVCVRTIVEKKRVRSKAHEEFIIRTRRRNQPDVFVSRRYGDFRTLADELRKAHPAETIPPPPAKDRTYVNVTLSAPPTASQSPPSPYGVYPISPAHGSVPTSPTNHTPRTSSRQSRPMPGMFQQNGSVDSINSVESQSTMSPTSPISGYGNSNAGVHASRLAREKNRLTLRSYVHILLSSSTFASSPVLKSFLLSGPTRLSEEELEDARRREEADNMREDGRKRFAKEIKERVEGLRGAVRSVKGELLGKDGLTHVFATIKETQDIRSLPDNYKAVIEWARISLASTVFQHFVAADDASESFAGLKRIHGLMPYFMLKAALKISNPMSMIRGVLDLFLAQPFGGKSLLQRMFSGSLMEEVKALEEDIESVKDKVEDTLMCEKVKLFVYAPHEIQAVYKADAAAEDAHVLTVILRSGEEPCLNRPQLQRVHRASIAYKQYTDSHPDSDDEGPEDDDAWLYEDLILLAKLYGRLRDREQLIALIFEGTTADLLKDIITIFYSPLAQVYRAASISDSLGDLQNFINDLIRTVESTEELSQQDPARTVQIFIDLIQRHEQSFYSFVHKVHSKGEGLFDSLMRWIEQFLTLMRDGLGDRVSLEFLLPHTGQERLDIMKEVDAVARYHYSMKVAYEAKVRRRFGRTQGHSDADAEDEEAAAMVNGVVRDLSFGELVKGDADELAAQDTDEEEDSSSEEEESSEEGTDSEESDSEESESSSEDTESDNGTEGPNARRTTPTPSLARSHTIGHSPVPTRVPRPAMQKQSLDLPSPRKHVQSPLRDSRAATYGGQSPLRGLPPFPLASSSSSSSKKLPPLPPSHGQERRRSPVKAPQVAKKKPQGPKPPELHHIPKLLPLFVEIMRPQLQPQR